MLTQSYHVPIVRTSPPTLSQGNAVFDVLSEFFYHENAAVQQGALEVYVRRAYVAYEIRKINFATIAESKNSVILWQYVSSRPVPYCPSCLCLSHSLVPSCLSHRPA